MTLLAIISIFVVAIALVGFLVGRHLTYEGYWLNSRKTASWALVCTIVATQVGAGTTLGIASSSATSGTGYGLVALITTVVGFLILPMLVPRVQRAAETSGEFTLTGLLRWRFGRMTGTVAALVVAIGYLGLLAAQLVAGAILLEQLTSLDWSLALVVSSGLVILYSAFAGLKGDLITDIFLFVFMAVLALFTVYALGTTLQSSPGVLGTISAEALSPTRFGGLTYLIGGVLLGTLVPLISLEMWLRVFAAESQATATSALRWSAVLVIPFYLLAMAVGLISTVVMAAPANPNLVYVEYLARILPSTLMTIVYLGLIATVISTTNTLQIVLSAVVHRDILPGQTESVAVSRIVTAATGMAAGIAAYFVRDIVDLVVSGFFYIVLLGPLLLILLRGAPAQPVSRLRDGLTALALLAGTVATTVGLPILGPGAVILGVLITSLLLFALALFSPKARA
ncbi:MAG: hypothetical protein Q8K99_07350 [Actinomycetota bacterium]|nr:hypothetical protein [Actinomycetota bacterium]